MAMVPVICDDCGAIWGAENAFGGSASNLTITGSKVRGCPRCGGWGSIPDGTYDLIDDTLRVVRSAGLPAATLQGLIGLLEAHKRGEASKDEVLERVESEAPALADTVRRYLAQEPASWFALLLTILAAALQPSPPSAEEIAEAVWAKDHSAAARTQPLMVWCEAADQTSAQDSRHGEAAKVAEAALATSGPPEDRDPDS
jgi:hypothetical protein